MVSLNMNEYLNIINILKTEPSARDYSQLHIIANFFNQYKFFNELTNGKIDKDLYTNITIIRLEKDEVLFNYGDRASAFYFVIKGRVDVFLPKINIVDSYETNLKKMSSIGTGGTFGELALITKRRREATIKASETSILAVCDRITYLKCINEKESLKLSVVVKILKSILPFNVERNRLMKLAYLFETIELKLNNQVYKAESMFSHLYIILEGEIKVI